VKEYASGTAYASGAGQPTEIIDYLYDTENRWIGENIISGIARHVVHETRFAYDGDQIILQFDENFSTPVSAPEAMTVANLSHRYLWQPNAVDQLMADEQVTSPNIPGNVVYPLTDMEGTIHDLAVATLNASTGQMNTTVVNHIVYDAFGNVVSSVNPQNPSSPPTVTCLFGYDGGATDPAPALSGGAQTALINFGNRWYSPQEMRWISQDPLGYDGGDTNLYRYCGNDVTNEIDPSGMGPPPSAPYRPVSGVRTPPGRIPAGSAPPNSARERLMSQIWGIAMAEDRKSQEQHVAQLWQWLMAHPFWGPRNAQVGPNVGGPLYLPTPPPQKDPRIQVREPRPHYAGEDPYGAGGAPTR
jgi:RHS repeat-associated protein